MAPLQRTVRIDELLITQLHVLETLTPEGFLEFRDPLKPASGLQSGQFRAIEVLGGFEGPRPRIRRHFRPVTAGITPSLQPADPLSALCASLRAHGFDAPDGDGTDFRERRIAALATLYRDHANAERAILHRVCELLLDHDEAIARWRFHHALMAAREIGSRPGTGGSRRRVPRTHHPAAVFPGAVGGAQPPVTIQLPDSLDRNSCAALDAQDPLASVS